MNEARARNGWELIQWSSVLAIIRGIFRYKQIRTDAGGTIWYVVNYANKMV